MYIILRNVRNNYHIRSNPLALGLFALIAEVVTMRTWVRDQGTCTNEWTSPNWPPFLRQTFLRLVDAKGVDLVTLFTGYMWVGCEYNDQCIVFKKNCQTGGTSLPKSVAVGSPTWLLQTAQAM